jgi:hypothetical protein
MVRSMIFADALTLDAPRRTADGYLAVRARAARTGVYQYTGREVDPDNKHGLRDQAIVNVLRDEAAVFDERAMRSFIGKPITTDHPAEPVNASNWKKYADGVIMGAVRDGQHLAFDLLLMDAQAISDVEAGRRELSNGYQSELQFGDYVAPDGTKCQARQDSIFGNHIARVKAGRAGSSCAITDSVALCDANPAAIAAFTQEKQVKKIVLDGLQVDLSDADAVQAAISKLQDKASKAETALADTQKAHDKALAAKDAEIDDLRSKVVDQATVDALANAKADVVGKAKTLLGDKAPDFAGKTIADVRRETVRLLKGDAAVADKSDDYVEARFDGLNDGAATQVVQPLGSPSLATNISNIRDAARAASNR